MVADAGATRYSETMNSRNFIAIRTIPAGLILGLLLRFAR